jgi:membrane protease subunit HflK
MYLEAMEGYLSEAKGIYVLDSDQKAMVPWLPLTPGADQSPQGGAK